MQKQQTCLWKVSNFTQRCFVGMQVFYPCYQTEINFFTTFCSVSFFIKTMLFQKGKPLKKHFLFILLCFIHICKLSFLQKILLERKISPLISQLQRNLLNFTKNTPTEAIHADYVRKKVVKICPALQC